MDNSDMGRASGTLSYINGACNGLKPVVTK